MTTTIELIQHVEMIGSYFDNAKLKEAAQRLRELDKRASTAESDLFELWKLVDERPADNMGIAKEYTKWNGLVYSLSILQEIDKREAV